MWAHGVVRGVVAVAMGLVAFPAGSQSPMQQQTEARCEQMAGFVIECVRPSATDPRIHRFDSANYALFKSTAKSNGQLLLFMPRTGGEPSGPKAFLGAAADAGYRVGTLARLAERDTSRSLVRRLSRTRKYGPAPCPVLRRAENPAGSHSDLQRGLAGGHATEGRQSVSRPGPLQSDLCPTKGIFSAGTRAVAISANGASLQMSRIFSRQALV